MHRQFQILKPPLLRKLYGLTSGIEISNIVSKIMYLKTRKYPLRGYILGVLTHTTALDRLWGGDGTLTMWF